MVDRSLKSVLALDPGATIGAAFASMGPDHRLTVEHWEKTADELLGWLWSGLVCDNFDRVVIERFNPRRWDNDSVSTVEIIGAIKWMCQRAKIPLGEVNAVDKSRTMKEVLEQNIKGRHARDAEAVRLWDLRYGTW